MATPPNDDTKTLFRMLADGEWHLYDEIRDQIAQAIPPGRALRKYQERVEYKRKYIGDPSYDTDKTEDERIYYGARACAQIVMTSWKDKGVEFAGTNMNKSVRRKPGFTTWGIENLPDDPEEPEIERGAAVVLPAVAEPNGSVPEGFVPSGYARLRDHLKPEEEVILIPTVEWVPQPEEEEKEPEPELPEPPVVPDPEESGPSPSVAIQDLPHCRECGLWIVVEERHKAWHLAQKPENERDDMALFSESEVRHLVDQVVSKNLDEFQAGMQGYLAAQFAQLEGAISALRAGSWRGSKTPPSGFH